MKKNYKKRYPHSLRKKTKSKCLKRGKGGSLEFKRKSNRRFENFQQKKQKQRRLLIFFLSLIFCKIDCDGDGKITETEFITQILINTYDVPLEIIQILKKHFNKLDRNQNGFLSSDDFFFATPRQI